MTPATTDLLNPQIPAAALTDPTVWAVTTAGMVGIMVLMGVSAFFSSSEIAMFALSKHRLEALVEHGAPHADTVHHLHEDPHRLLVTILVGNNVANIAMASIATAIVGFHATQAQAVLITTIGISALVLVFCESTPKAYAIDHTETWALRVARPLYVSGYLLAPFIQVFDTLTRWINSLLGTGTDIERAYLTRTELKDLIAASEREGAIETDERDRLQRVFRYSEATAREIMVPRPDIVAVPTTATLEDAIGTCASSGFTHLPVYEDTLDTIVGLVHVCDLISARGTDEGESVSLEDVMRPTLHIPATIPADEVLVQMQRAHTHLAVIIDEFGMTEGIVTTEDPTEVVLGEILMPDEPQPIRRIDEHTAIIQGDVPITEINDHLNLNLPEDTPSDTLAGLILEWTGRLPEQGDRITHDPVTITIEDVSATRIHRVRLTRHDNESLIR